MLNASWLDAKPYHAPTGRAVVLGWGLLNFAAPRGITPQPCGTPTLRLLHHFIRPEGAPSRTRLGAPQVTLDGQYITPVAQLDATWLGQTPYADPVGGVHGAWFVSNVTYLDVAGLDALGVGEPDLLQSQFVTPAGFDDLRFGRNLSALFTWQYSPPEGWLNALWYGRDVYIDAAGLLNAAWSLPSENKLISLVGQDATEWGEARIWHGQLWLAPYGADASALGVPHVWNVTQVVVLSGFDAAVVSMTTSLQHGTRYILPTGVSAPAPPHPSMAYGGSFPRELKPSGTRMTEYGTAELTQTGDYFARPAPILSDRYGQPTVINRNRYILAGVGAPALAFGKDTRIWNRDQYVVFDKGGIPGFEAGEHEVAAGIRYLILQGWMSSQGLASARPWASHSPRTLAPSGAPEPGFKGPVVGGLRFIEPGGFDATEWGSRIVPLATELHPSGFSGELGSPEVCPNPRYLRPLSVPRVEDLRWGTHHVWNTRQYIHHEYLEDADLNGEKWGSWNYVFNRTRYVGAFGILPPAIPQPPVLNKAVPVLPRGADSARVERPMISHGVRYVVPDTWDSLVSLSWHRAYNNAAVVHMFGSRQDQHGTATVVNTRRYYSLKGAETTEWGADTFVAFRIRHVSFDPLYSIEPPPVRLPEVKLAERWVFPHGYDAQGVDAPYLAIHRTAMAPKGFVPGQWGPETSVRNKTPQYRMYGWAADEYGLATLVRHQFRHVHPEGAQPLVFGRHVIADRRLRIAHDKGIAPPAVSHLHRITRTGQDPGHFEQFIRVNNSGMNTFIGQQVGQHSVQGRSIFPDSTDDDMSRFGEVVVHANSIRVEPGIWEHKMGKPTVTGPLVLEPETFGPPVNPGAHEALQYFGKPRATPHTIWCWEQPPMQALDNNPGGAFGPLLPHGSGGVSVRMGQPRVEHQHRTINHGIQAAAPVFATYGMPRVWHGRQYVLPEGARTMRVGFPEVDGGLRWLEVFGPSDTMALGTPRLTTPGAWVRTVTPSGFEGAVGEHEVQNLHRQIHPKMWDSATVAGVRRQYSHFPYQPQELFVHFPMPTIPEGWEATQWGDTWISLWVREVLPEGSDFAEVAEYDAMNFKTRMRVHRGHVERPHRTVLPEGFSADVPAYPHLRHGARFIRPDGNSDQYRKGGLKDTP